MKVVINTESRSLPWLASSASREQPRGRWVLAYKARLETVTSD